MIDLLSRHPIIGIITSFTISITTTQSTITLIATSLGLLIAVITSVLKIWEFRDKVIANRHKHDDETSSLN